MVISYEKLQHQISKLQEIADKKASQVEIDNYLKYNPLFEKLIAFIKAKRVLLYGGLALNGILPKPLQFYGENTLPDLDVFCVSGEKLAKEVVSHFKRSGYQFSSSSEALHKGTYKVYAEGVQLLDITTIDEVAFKRLSKNAITVASGIKTVDPEFLRMTLHIMLSQPRDSHRWSKVLERLVAFYTAHPVEARCKTAFANEESKNQDVFLNAIEGAGKWLASRDYVMFGTDAVVEVMGISSKMRKLLPPGRPILFKGIAPLAVLVDKEEPEAVAKHCVEQMMHSSKDKDVYTIELFPADDFLPAHSRIIHAASKQPLVTVYEAPACVSYITYNGVRVASIHTLVRMLMAHEFSPQKHARAAAPLYRCFSNVLSLMMLETLSGKKKKLLEQFLVDCYGFQAGLATLRKMRMQRLVK